MDHVFLVASGAGYFYNPIDIIGRNAFLSAAYDNDGKEIQIISKYTGKIASLPCQLIESAYSVIYNGKVENNIELTSNDTLYITQDTGSYDPNTGDGYIVVRMLYELLSATFSTINVPSLSTPITGTFVNADLDISFNLELYHGKGTINIVGVVIIYASGISEVKTFALGKADLSDTTNYITVNFGGAVPAGTHSYQFFTLN